MKKIKRVNVWTTTDGKTFDVLAEAHKHQAALWFQEHVDGIEAVAGEIVAAIAGNRESFHADVGPVFAKERKPRSAATAKGKQRAA